MSDKKEEVINNQIVDFGGMSYFNPTDDITLKDVVEVLKLIGLGIQSDGIPEDLKKHFQVYAPPEE